MATILDQYLEKQNTIRSQIAENSLPPEDLLIMQELNYRICVLETFQSFCKSAPITLDTKVMGYHFQMVDAYVRFTLNERRFGLKADAEAVSYTHLRVHLRAKYGKIDSPMKIDVTTGDIITPAAIQYDFPLIFDEKTVSIMAYTLETVLAEKYETIIRRNIGTTRARDFYDLHTLFRSRKEEINVDILRMAVIHTAQKRESVEDIRDWKAIIKDIREEPQMYLLWDKYIVENKYIGELEFHQVLDLSLIHILTAAIKQHVRV